MALQYISDDAGNHTAVVIPINQWNEITARHEDIKELTAAKTDPATSKKPSDYAGTMSKEEGEAFSQYVEQSRNGWEKKFLIDTNVLIDFQLKQLPESGKNYLVEIIDHAFIISFVTYIEFLGYPLATAAMENFIKLAGVIQIDKEIIEQTIALRRIKKIKLPDAIIAATAIIHGYTLISRNMNDFKNIKHLEVINPHEF